MVSQGEPVSAASENENFQQVALLLTKVPAHCIETLQQAGSEQRRESTEGLGGWHVGTSGP